MPQVLFVHSSIRLPEAKKESPGSFTRKIAGVMRDSLKMRGVNFVERDVAKKPPRLIDQSWIQASGTAPEQRTPDQVEKLRESDELVSEVMLSDVIVISCPIYNFGIPAPLKAWIDNIMRPGKTFTVDTKRKPQVIYGMLHNKMVVFLISSGSSGYRPGGVKASLNHADPAVRAVFSQLGVRSFDEIVFEGACEAAPEELEVAWNKCEIDIARVVASIRSRWNNAR